MECKNYKKVSKNQIFLLKISQKFVFVSPLTQFCDVTSYQKTAENPLSKVLSNSDKSNSRDKSILLAIC